MPSKGLYHPLILQHNDEPYHYQKTEDASLVVEAYNPVCGDQFRLFLKLEGDMVQEAFFHGYGCAVSKASTSVLVRRIEGKKLGEVKALIAEFLKYVNPEKEPPADGDEEFLPFSAARRYPGRLKCATLAWDNLKKEFR